MFLVRNDKLNITQIVRSQDFIWGLPYNFIQFGYITQYIAEKIGVEVGCYHEMVQSLHVYEQHWGDLVNIARMEPQFPEALPRINDIDHKSIRAIMYNMEEMYEKEMHNNLVSYLDEFDPVLSPFWHDALRVIHAYWLNKARLVEDAAYTLMQCKYPTFVILATRYFTNHYKGFSVAFRESNSKQFMQLRNTVITGVIHC